MLGSRFVPYRLEEQIGRGARSEIWRVSHERTGQTFCLKRVLRSPSEDDRFLRQAVVEYEYARRIEDPHVRQVISLRRFRRMLRVVELHLLMEHVDGVTLERRRPEQMPDHLALFRQVALGLAAMHDAGFLHCDIKPNNILISPDGSVRIIDLGQCCPIHHVKKRIQGTPDYIAPEQVRRLPLDRRTDAYNLGATMYWALTGQTYPTVLRSAKGEFIPRATTNEPPAPRELDPGIPPAMSRLVMECCQTDPTQRPRDMAEVLARLDLVEHILSKYGPAGATAQGSPNR